MSKLNIPNFGLYELPKNLYDIISSYGYLRQLENDIFSVSPMLWYNISNDNPNYFCSSIKSLYIYSGFLGDIGAQGCNLILPSCYYYEDCLSDISFLNVYMNCSGTYRVNSVFLSKTSVFTKNFEEVLLMFTNFLELFTVAESKNYDFFLFQFFLSNDIYFDLNQMYYLSRNIVMLNLFSDRNSLYINSQILQKIKCSLSIKW